MTFLAGLTPQCIVITNFTSPYLCILHLLSKRILDSNQWLKFLAKCLVVRSPSMHKAHLVLNDDLVLVSSSWVLI